MAGATTAGAGGGVAAQPTTKAETIETSASVPPRRAKPIGAPRFVAAIQTHSSRRMPNHVTIRLQRLGSKPDAPGQTAAASARHWRNIESFAEPDYLSEVGKGPRDRIR